MIAATALTVYTVPNRFIAGVERRVEGAGLGIHRATATAARIRYQDIYAAPTRGHLGHHGADGFMIGDIASMPIAVPPAASISATVLSPVMSRASASNSS